MADVPLGREPEPGEFARALSDQIRLALTTHRTSGAQLGVLIGRSQSYVSKRLRNESSFSLNDVQLICEVLGLDLPKLLNAAIRAMRSK